MRNFKKLIPVVAIVMVLTITLAGIRLSPDLFQLAIAQSKPQIVDTIYVDGKVYTVNGDQKWAEAFAVDDGKFVQVGSNEEILSLRDDTTQVIDLRGGRI